MEKTKYLRIHEEIKIYSHTKPCCSEVNPNFPLKIELHSEFDDRRFSHKFVIAERFNWGNYTHLHEMS